MIKKQKEFGVSLKVRWCCEYGRENEWCDCFHAESIRTDFMDFAGDNELILQETTN